MRTAMERRPYRGKAAVHADGATRGRAAGPSAAASRQDGGSPCGEAASSGIVRARRGEVGADRRQDGGSLLKRRARRFPEEVPRCIEPRDRLLKKVYLRQFESS